MKAANVVVGVTKLGHSIKGEKSRRAMRVDIYGF